MQNKSTVISLQKNVFHDASHRLVEMLTLITQSALLIWVCLKILVQIHRKCDIHSPFVVGLNTLTAVRVAYWSSLFSLRFVKKLVSNDGF